MSSLLATRSAANAALGSGQPGRGSGMYNIAEVVVCEFRIYSMSQHEARCTSRHCVTIDSAVRRQLE
jgi:hypothetical protein